MVSIINRQLLCKYGSGGSTSAAETPSLAVVWRSLACSGSQGVAVEGTEELVCSPERNPALSAFSAMLKSCQRLVSSAGSYLLCWNPVNSLQGDSLVWHAVQSSLPATYVDDGAALAG